MLSLNPDMWFNLEKISSRFGSWRHCLGDGQRLRPSRGWWEGQACCPKDMDLVNTGLVPGP